MIDLDSLDGIDIVDSKKNYTLASEQNLLPGIHSTSMSCDDANILTSLLITANVGTIFEESTLLDLWIQQLRCYLAKIRPQVVAIHCQEVGGKNFESSMKHVSNFTDKIIGDELVAKDYSRVRIFLDENLKDLEKFTALGSIYLIHDSVKDAKLYNFKTAQFESVEGNKVYSDRTSNDDNFEHVEKVKFPQDLFPECRWSRKGFMRTRWLLNERQPIDLVNIHLFHDASNIVAMKSTPSPYAQNRQRALEFTLDRVSRPLPGGIWIKSHQISAATKPTGEAEGAEEEEEDCNTVPLFIFGDFNFRLDTNRVIQRITDGVLPVVKKSDSNEVIEIIYHRRQEGDQVAFEQEVTRAESKVTTANSISAITKRDDDGNSNYLDGGGGVLVTVGKKLFDCENLDETFRATENTEWLQEMDNELDSFKSKLFEFKISFSPSYPFREDASGSHSYMKTRCPAWCDRILFNQAGCRLIHSKVDLLDTDAVEEESRIERLQKQGDVIYRLMGNSVPMGDHKPVLLYCKLNLNSAKATTTAETIGPH